MGAHGLVVAPPELEFAKVVYFVNISAGTSTSVNSINVHPSYRTRQQRPLLD